MKLKFILKKKLTVVFELKSEFVEVKSMTGKFGLQIDNLARVIVSIPRNGNEAKNDSEKSERRL